MNNTGIFNLPGADCAVGEIRIIPLGGLHEIGKNMTVFEYEDEIIIVDCGMSFPDAEMYGIDLVIPDFTYIKENKSKVKGIIITHGHEDHIGALPFLVKDVDVPIYITGLAKGLLEHKLSENNLPYADIHQVGSGDVFKVGRHFTIECIATNHSIADSIAVAITTPAGTIIHTGDFKIDFTPIDGKVMNLARFAELGTRGVLALLSDSTNAERPGYTMSEKTVGKTFDNIFANAPGRIIIATFASNVHRMQQAINSAEKYGRKYCVCGRSVETVFNIAKVNGYLKINPNNLIELEDIDKYKPENLLIITTGSQGEPMSALSRMANDEHRLVKMTPRDTVILSASSIPGNERAINNVINRLKQKGVNVIYESLAEVHVSGHACAEELKLIQTLVKPKYFVPVHGEVRHLMCHADIAQELGIPKERIFLMNNGDVLTLSEKEARITGKVTAGAVFVDGTGVGDVGNVVLHDRKLLAMDGVVVIVFSISKTTAELLAGPEIITRGFVFVRENEELLARIRNVVTEAIMDNFDEDIITLKKIVSSEAKTEIFKITGRKPLIMPVVQELD